MSVQPRAGSVSDRSPVRTSGHPSLTLPARILALAALCAAGPTTRAVHPTTRPGEIRELTLPDLGNFDYDPDDKTAKIPDDVKALSGVTVRVSGFLIPLDQAEKITKFALVPTLGNGHAPPPFTHTLIVTTPKGQAVDYSPDPITVTGRITVGEIKDDGFTVALYTVEATSVKPVNPPTTLPAR